jgi:hypothetical protein
MNNSENHVQSCRPLGGISICHLQAIITRIHDSGKLWYAQPPHTPEPNGVKDARLNSLWYACEHCFGAPAPNPSVNVYDRTQTT